MCLVFQSHTLEQLGVSKDVRVTSDHGMFEENLKKHLSKKMLAVYVFKHFESFRSIQFEFGKTGRILIGYSGCTSSQASSNTSEHYSIRGVHRSVFGRIRARIFGFLRSELPPYEEQWKSQIQQAVSKICFFFLKMTLIFVGKIFLHFEVIFAGLTYIWYAFSLSESNHPSKGATIGKGC